MNKQIDIIAVDLTPVLPGGENGGAKIFVLELLRRLADMAPSTQFVLLTQSSSHEELAYLDCRNMRRYLIGGAAFAGSFRSQLVSFASRVSPLLPDKVRNAFEHIGYKLNSTLKRRKVGSLLRILGADLLFCPFTAPTYAESGIPTVCTLYDLQYKTYPEFFTSAEVAHRDRTFIDACRRATVLTAISDYSRDSAIAHGDLDASRIRTIHLRMSQRIMPEANCELTTLHRLGLSRQRFLIYPANFWKHKNHEMLLTAFGIACRQGLATDIKLICTGAPGPRQDWLKTAARGMNLSDRIVFPGYLPSVELATLLANCSGVIFPSLYEGFGLPVIEAMAAGAPVACSNITSLPEVASDAALLFDPRIPTQIAQAMISLVNDETMRARCVNAGLKRAAEFSDSVRMAGEYWELFLYALANTKYESTLSGAYVDGWVGHCINIYVAPSESSQILEIDFLVPDWAPQQRLTAQVIQDGKKQGRPIALDRGMSAALSLEVGPNGGSFEVRLGPIFVPASSGFGEDSRELSAILKKCRVVREDGKYVELCPEKSSV